MKKGDDLRARAFQFACAVVAFSDDLERHGWSARKLGGQLLRAGTSIGANLEEADAAQSRADFISKCTISLKEVREAHYWLRLLRATNKLDTDGLLAECNELVSILTTIVRKASA